MGRKLFCELGPTCYKISIEKEILVRFFKDLFSKEKIAKTKGDTLPNIVKCHSSVLIRRLHGVDLQLQENKVTNIRLSSEQINGIVIKPGETFSFWRTS
ncbi:MAG: VanW family protein, partial [Clostridiaceae bacterium]|nr:VanW family protein [Clostridiaceae bacterium]